MNLYLKGIYPKREQIPFYLMNVVRGSLLDRAYVYQIFSCEKTPSRDTLIAIAFGLGLSDAETQQNEKLENRNDF